MLTKSWLLKTVDLCFLSTIFTLKATMYFRWCSAYVKNNGPKILKNSRIVIYLHSLTIRDHVKIKDVSIISSNLCIIHFVTMFDLDLDVYWLPIRIWKTLRYKVIVYSFNPATTSASISWINLPTYCYHFYYIKIKLQK